MAAVGRDVSSFKQGDRVLGTTGLRLGIYAEYVRLPETVALAIMPDAPGYEGAAVPVGGTDALHFPRAANVRRGQRVLVYGASGSIGAFAVQIAKYHGAEVTGVCGTANLDMVLSIGADEAIDHTREDPLGEEYDVIFDAVGKSSFSGCVRSLMENGTYLLSNPTVPDTIQGGVDLDDRRQEDRTLHGERGGRRIWISPGSSSSTGSQGRSSIGTIPWRGSPRPTGTWIRGTRGGTW